MRKVFLLLLISLILIFVSGFVFADKDKSEKSSNTAKESPEDENFEESVETGSEEDVDTASVNAPAVVNPVTAEKVKSVKQTIEERVSKKKELLERAKQSREKTREAFMTARDELKDARQKFKDSQKALIEAKKSVEKCKSINSDECKKARKDNKAHSAKFVDGSIEQVYKMLERAKKAAESSNINEEQKAQLVSDLDAKLAELGLLRQKQGQIQSQNTAREIKDAAKNMKNFWSNSKHSVQKNNLKVSSSKLGGLVVKMEKLQVRLNAEIEKFKNNGKDTAELDTKIALFNEKISAVKNLNAEIVGLLETVDSAENKSEVMKSATGKMKEAHVFLNDAKSILNDIRGSLKAHEALFAGVQQ